MVSSSLRNLAGDGTTSAEDLGERCQSMVSSSLCNLAGDGTTSAEDLGERRQSMVFKCFIVLPATSAILQWSGTGLE